jgi:hypothetical protein
VLTSIVEVKHVLQPEIISSLTRKGDGRFDERIAVFGSESWYRVSGQNLRRHGGDEVL